MFVPSDRKLKIKCPLTTVVTKLLPIYLEEDISGGSWVLTKLSVRQQTSVEEEKEMWVLKKAA